MGRAISSGRDSADLYHGLGSVLVGQGKLDEAVQALQLAVEREPGNAGYQLELGRALAYANQDPLQAIAHLREAMRLAPETGSKPISTARSPRSAIGTPPSARWPTSSRTRSASRPKCGPSGHFRSTRCSHAG